MSQNSVKCVDTCPKASWKCVNCGGNHNAAYKGWLSYKNAITNLIDKQQNISYAQAVCRRAAKEEIANVIINIQQLAKLTAIVIWEINSNEFDYINKMSDRISKIVRETVKNSSD